MIDRLLRLLAFLPLAILSSLSAFAADSPPNIVVVFIDDMGWTDVSSFGGTAVETENIDQLAAEGLRFTNFYVNAPICSPSRVALSTGQYPQRWRIGSFLARRRVNQNRGMANWLDPAAPMLARNLQQAGYATGHFGKWHMGGQRDVGEAPLITEYGFDASLTNFEGLGPRILPLCDAYDGTPPRRHDLGSADLGRGPIRWVDRSQVTVEFVDASIDFIQQSTANGKPFYINLWPDDVHSPFFPPEARRSDEGKRALYNAVLETMDEQLGVLFDHIRQDAALRDNTLVVFASDNGPEAGAGVSTPLRGTKGSLYEGGIRSPLIVWGPGLMAQQSRGKTNDSAVLSAIDVNASLYKIAGVTPPENAQLDGELVVDTLLGRETQGRTEPIFWRRPPDRPGPRNNRFPDLAVRSGKWKLLMQTDGSGQQLYDLSQDAAEQHNLADQFPEVAMRLAAQVSDWNAELPADAGTAPLAELPNDQFINPIAEGADPWVIRDPNADRYLWCQSEGNRGIAIWTSNRLTSMGQKHVVWQAPESGPYSAEVWAPELHFLDGRWYVYFAASDGDNVNHLTYVLRSDGDDPLGNYTLHGPLATGEGEDRAQPNIWAIDMTVLEHDGERYAIWSGWDAPGSDQQYLYAAAMKSPTELTGPRVRLCDNDDYLWERTEETAESRGLHEAPQVLKSGDRTFVVYSTGASWLPTYKLGMLELVGDDPLDPAAWKKFEEPVFQSTEATFGVGHSSFVRSPDGSQWWHVFHAKLDKQPGWRRAIFVQPFQFASDGTPRFGKPIAAGVALDRPSGEPDPQPGTQQQNPLTTQRPPAGMSYLGHHQMIDLRSDGLHLGINVEKPINDYRSGEKVVWTEQIWDDFRASATIRFEQGQRDAGILFRSSGNSIGYDAQRGYFAGIVPQSGIVVLGRTDGSTWSELARSTIDIDLSQPVQLAVTAQGDSIRVDVDGERKIDTHDDTYSTGHVGLRVVDTHAVFTNLEIDDLQRGSASDDTADNGRSGREASEESNADRQSSHRAQPNIVILVADDLGWADVSYHNRRADTPVIDGLARDGIELDRFYVAPMCSPTRAGLMTGRYPIRFGMARAVIPPYRDFGLSPAERTLPEALAEAGYQHRAVFGKWHLGHRRPQWHPLRQGFTHFHGHYNGAIDYFALTRDGERDWHVNWEPSNEQGYSTELIAQAAADWIDEAADHDRPYLCYVPFNAPHSPFQALPRDLQRYERIGGDPSRVDGPNEQGRIDPATRRRALIAMIWRMDHGIGQILEAIDRSGEGDNTIVWFTSDNGGIRGVPNNNQPLRGNKLDVFEGGVRVPACVRWPAAWPGGRKLAEPMNCVDLLPTLVSAAGGDLETPAAGGLDGIDLGPLLSGDADSLPPRDLYFYHGQQGPDEEKIAITTPRWKLIVNGPQLTEPKTAAQHEVLLFRMPDDLLEEKNVATEHPEVVQELLGKLVEFRALQPADSVKPYAEGRRGFTPPPRWQLAPEGV